VDVVKSTADVEVKTAELVVGVGVETTVNVVESMIMVLRPLVNNKGVE
jgi:hypothetical protein